MVIAQGVGHHVPLQIILCCLMVVCSVGQPCVAVVGQSGNTVTLDIGRGLGAEWHGQWPWRS